jgi:signal transduction histidine kinase
MRARLIALLLLLSGCVLLALGVPLADSLANGREQALYVDRLQDASRFASIVQHASSASDEAALHDDLVRYGDVYGVTAALVDQSAQPVASAGRPLDLGAPATRRRIHDGLAGHQSEQPPTIWPWQTEDLVVTVPVIQGDDVVGTVVIASPTDRLRLAVARDLAWLGVGELAAVALVVFAAIRLAVWVLRPVYLLDAAAHEVSSGRLSTRVLGCQGPGELRRLVESFNTMVGAVENAVVRQRNFAADASHQLRNPLAALMLRLETFGLGLDQLQRTEYEEVRKEAGRLHATVDELLALATAQESRGRAVRVDLGQMVSSRVAAWQLSARGKNVRFDVPEAVHVDAYVDPCLTASALDAVLDNAIKFSPEAGTVSIFIVGLPDAVHLTVADNGPGLRPEEFDRIGDRFWRSPETQDIAGSGLGLSIASNLLAACGGTIRFAPAVPRGLQVTFELPKAPETDEMSRS